MLLAYYTMDKNPGVLIIVPTACEYFDFFSFYEGGLHVPIIFSSIRIPYEQAVEVSREELELLRKL